MQKRLPNSDIVIQKNIAEHRCLTASQLAILTGRKPQLPDEAGWGSSRIRV